MDHSELVQANKDNVLVSWTAQKRWNPISMVRGEGVYFWDADGKRYLDWSSQLFNVNIGHGNQHVIQAIQSQASDLTYAYPGLASEPRAILGRKLAEIAPGDAGKTFFTLGGSDAVENALKMARLATGREKIMTRYRGYHGASLGAMSAGGDPRRLPNEPGVPWIVRFHDPYSYRSPLYRNRSVDKGDQVLVDQIAETIEYEGSENIAAMLIEGYSGSSGVIQGGEVFWRGIQSLCDEHDILLIIDEVLSGFGRTGEWFGIDHYPYVQPDMVVMAKGLTSGYLPLGAVVVSKELASHFDENVLWGGLTYSGHPVSCAAAIANIEVYESENLIQRSQKMGTTLRAGLLDLAEGHEIIGEVRGVGLHQVIELVKDRKTREPMSDFNQPPSEPMQRVASALRAQGLSTFVRWNWIFCMPPLIIEEDQLNQGLEMLDIALREADA
jgi:taurine--2-oxoglutarate transaminase